MTRVLAPTVFVFCLIGCGQPNKAPAASPSPDPRMMTDQSITLQVKTKLAFFGADGMNVRVLSDNGVVTLNGIVASNAVRTKFEAAARTIKGVSRVADRLLTKP